MKALISLLIVISLISATFAVWPIVTDAPWEPNISPAESDNALCQGALDYRAAIAANPPTRSFRDEASGPPTFGPNRNLGPLIAITDQDLLIRLLDSAQRQIQYACPNRRH